MSAWKRRVQAAALALALGLACPRGGFGGELDLFVSAGGADIEWGHRTLAGGARLMAGRFFLEPSYLDIRSDRDDDVHRGLAWQVGLGARVGAIRPYFAMGAKLEGHNLAWLSTGVRFGIRQRIVVTPELRLGYFDIEPSPRGYTQLAVNVGISFAWDRAAAKPPSGLP